MNTLCNRNCFPLNSDLTYLDMPSSQFMHEALDFIQIIYSRYKIYELIMLQK